MEGTLQLSNKRLGVFVEKLSNKRLGVFVEKLPGYKRLSNSNWNI